MNERRLRLKGKVAIVTGAGSRGEGVGNGKANLSETLPFNPQVVGSIPTGPTKLANRRCALPACTTAEMRAVPTFYSC